MAERGSEGEAEACLTQNADMPLKVLARRLRLIMDIRCRANEVASPGVMTGYFEFLCWAAMRGFRVKLLLGGRVQDLGKCFGATIPERTRWIKEVRIAGCAIMAGLGFRACD